MRAVSVRIHNFRSFADAKINLHPYALIVGANNCGKSNMVDAIRVFYEKVKYEDSRDFTKFTTDDKESWIELKFCPSDAEFALLPEEYRLSDGTFCVRKYLKSTEKDDKGKQKGGIYAYIGGELSGTLFYGAKNVQQGKFGEIIYVPAVSKLDEHTKLTGPSALRDLINAILKKIMVSSSAYSTLTDAFETFSSSLKDEKTDDGQSLSKLEDEISAELSDWATHFELSINSDDSDDLVKTLVQHQIRDDALGGKTIDSAGYGQEFQRQLIFTLIKLAARLATRSTTTGRRDFSPSLTWILFEEPEAFSHPSQIDILDASLRDIANSEGNQVLITTHNPQFASKCIEDLPSLARLCRVGAQSKNYHLDANELRSILESNQQDIEKWKAAGVRVHDDDEQIDMESIKYALWLNPLRGNAFFANKVLLVEGPTELALIGYMLGVGQIPTPAGGVCLLDTMGKWNTHRFMNMFGALGIAHYVLCDYDEGNGKHGVVYETIEASKSEHTIRIDRFDQDIEAFLGLPRPKDPRRKPQHVMWHLSRGNIDSARLESLTEKVACLLGVEGYSDTH